MKQETLKKAKELQNNIQNQKEIITMLKERGLLYLSQKACNYHIVETVLKKDLLPVFENYLKKLEKEFEEL